MCFHKDEVDKLLWYVLETFYWCLTMITFGRTTVSAGHHTLGCL